MVWGLGGRGLLRERECEWDLMKGECGSREEGCPGCTKTCLNSNLNKYRLALVDWQIGIHLIELIELIVIINL